MKVKRATPVLFVDRVEPTRDFFTRVGFDAVAEAPDRGGLGFVSLQKAAVPGGARSRATR